MESSPLIPASILCVAGGALVHEIGETCITRPTPPPYILEQAPGNTWSQSVDNTTIVAGSTSCPAGLDDSYWRLYDPLACVPPVTTAYFVDSVTFGVEQATTTSGSTLITVNLRDGTGFPVGGSTAPILCSARVDVPDTDLTMQTFVTVSFDPPCCLAAGQTIAVEVMIPSGPMLGFFIGSNDLGETAPTYISAPSCGLIDPIPFAAIGFPNIHGLIDLECRPKDEWRLRIPGYVTFGSMPGQFCACGLSWSGNAITGVSAAAVDRTDTGERIFDFDPNPVTTAAWGALLPGADVRGFLAASGVVQPGMTVELVFRITAQPNTCIQAVATALLAGAVGTDEGTASGGLTGARLRVWPPAGIEFGELGTSYCGPAVANSTGSPAVITATGSSFVCAGDVTLTATGLPPGQFGYFLVSRTPGSFNPPNSQGLLCLAGNIGRYDRPADIIVGPTGSLTIDLSSIPVTPNHAVQPGETWNFQCWYRDINPGHTSNFTDGRSIRFQ